MTSILETSAIRISQIDRVLLEIDTIIKTAYDAAGIVGPARAAAEKELLIAARIPPSLNPVVDQLLSRIMDGLRKEIDRAELYFADFSWLGLTSEEGGNGGKRKLIDTLRKVPLKKGTPLRRCTRCCAVMQDGMQPSVLWLTNMQRACVCGSLWMIVD
jgi:mediator of RNA polymerase II transcription subunit 16